ncbi:MAG: hypothetical protein IPK82_14415 [Polyangiaceae bacterium]|nr:hypothetical protein [Polyangiaceae bacterium]
MSRFAPRISQFFAPPQRRVYAFGWRTALVTCALSLAGGSVAQADSTSPKVSSSKGDSKKSASAKKGKGKKPTPPPPLQGQTVDYAYDGKDVGHPERAWAGRAFVHTKAAVDPNKALPLFVFVHGINSEQIKYRWMGGGNEGDVRRIVSDLIDSGQLPPVLVAAPSSVNPQNIMVATTSWMGFDLDHFVEKTAAALKGTATIDKTKIIVAGHSGGGCNVKGGIATAIGAKNVHSALVIDTCMGTDLASHLAKAKKSLNVVVTWQALTWGKRPLTDFKKVFERDVKANPADTGILRTLELMTPKEPMPHDAMVPLTLKKYLPMLVPPPKTAVAASTQSTTAGSTQAAVPTSPSEVVPTGHPTCAVLSPPSPQPTSKAAP